MRVSDILDRKGSSVVTVHTSDSVLDTATGFRARNIGAAPVADDNGEMVGLVSERDIVIALARMGPAALSAEAKTVMTTPVLTCAPDHGIRSVIKTMTERRVRHLPVIEAGRLVGIVSIGDVLKPRLDESELEMNVLRDIARVRLAH